MNNKQKLLLTSFLMIGYLGYAKTNIEPKETSSLVLYLWCFLGCFLQEFIYFFELKHEIAKGNSPVELKSRSYFIITIIGIIVFSGSSFLYFYYGDTTQPTFFTTAVFSAGFAKLFKSAVSSAVNTQGQNQLKRLDALKKRPFTIKDYFNFT